MPASSLTLSPAGITTASQSRESVTCSFWEWYMPESLRRDGLVVAARDRGLERVPREARALHPRRVFAHTRERGELVEVRGGLAGAREQTVNLLEQRERRVDRLSLDAFGHQRGRGDRDRAARSFEADILDSTIADF